MNVYSLGDKVIYTGTVAGIDKVYSDTPGVVVGTDSDGYVRINFCSHDEWWIRGDASGLRLAPLDMGTMTIDVIDVLEELEQAVNDRHVHWTVSRYKDTSVFYGCGGTADDESGWVYFNNTKEGIVAALRALLEFPPTRF